jgi:hypothetical protein
MIIHEITFVSGGSAMMPRGPLKMPGYGGVMPGACGVCPTPVSVLLIKSSGRRIPACNCVAEAQFSYC